MHRLFVLPLVVGLCRAQAPDVPIYTDPDHEGNSEEDGPLLAAAGKLKEQTKLLDMAEVRRQLTRKPCRLTLPTPKSERLDGAQVCRTARAAYVRVGYYHLCKTCDQWHVTLAGGYVIAAHGIVATCHHVVAPDDEEMKEGYLVCADDRGQVYPVREVLTCDATNDVAILRTDATSLPALPLRVEVHPGEPAYLFSDPMAARGYFSAGVVNRFAREVAEDGVSRRVVMNVSTDWAPGSSGAAVLDERGNAIGHVSTISTLDDDAESEPMGTFMVLRRAVRAADVLALIEKPAPAGDVKK